MTMTTAEGTRPRAFALVGQALAWVVILVSVFVVAVAVLVPRIGGATPYTILTSSMEPKYPAGTLVVVKPIRPEDVSVGTIITFQLRSGQSTVVTHRVVEVAYAQNGELEFTTQGDANDGVDLEPVKPVQIRGALWYAVPKLGWASQLADQSQRNAAVRVVAGGLALYAGTMFLGTVRDLVIRRRRPHGGDGDR